MRKESSSNWRNEHFLVENCSVNAAINVIGGRWKCQIISSIYKGTNRFNLLKKEMPGISEQVLSRQLKELENHFIIYKINMHNVVPLGVQYCLSIKGNDLVPVLQSLCKWNEKHKDIKKVV